MRKILIALVVIFSVFLIYLGFNDKKIYYFSMGDFLSLGINPYKVLDYGYSDYVKDYLSSKDILEAYTDSLSRENKRITDIIQDIKDNSKLLVGNKEKTIQNVLIKSDLVTISIGMNDLFSNVSIDYEFTTRDLYNKFDSLLSDYEELFKLLREYCKEKIVLIGLYNVTDTDLDEFFNYANNKLNDLCNKYNINYINISEDFKNNKYIDKTSNYPNKKGYEYISNKIINLIEN